MIDSDGTTIILPVKDLYEHFNGRLPYHEYILKMMKKENK